MRKPLGSIAVLALAGLVSGGALAAEQQDTPPKAASDKPVGQVMADSAITAKVKTSLLADTQAKGTQINVDTSNGVVTLTGEVDSQDQIWQAGKIAQNVEGVRSVNNRLVVRVAQGETKPGMVGGGEVKVQGSLADRGQPALSAFTKFDLNQDGQVTREEVNPTNARAVEAFNQADKNQDAKLDQSEFVAFYGSFDFQTREAMTTREGSGPQVKTLEPTQELGRDRGAPATTPSTATSGTPADTGRVAAGQPERNMERRDPSDRTAAQFFEDAWITTKTKSALLVDDSVKGMQINVDTYQNVVTLQGKVESQAQAAQAQKLAAGIEGVKSVENKLMVAAAGETRGDARTDTRTDSGGVAGRTGEIASDAALTAKVKSAFLIDSEVKGLQINVDTQGGVVTLKGTVDSQAQAAKARQIAQNIEGVKSVNSQLAVKQ